MKLSAVDLLKPFEECIGSPYMLWPDGGFWSGSENTSVNGVLLTWMATVDSLEQAIKEKCNVVICHENPFYVQKREVPAYRWMTPFGDEKEPEWYPNTKRRALIKKHKLTVIQSHYGLDRFCNFHAFSEALGLNTIIFDHGWETVYKLDNPCSVAQLAGTIKERLKIDGTMRISGDPNRIVERVANLWGGEGLISNLYWITQAINNGAQVGICGEMDEFFMNFAREANFPAIETSHQLSEEFGIEYYANYLKKKHPTLKVTTHLKGRPYITL